MPVGESLREGSRTSAGSFTLSFLKDTMNYCKFENVRLVATNNASLTLIVFHHRYEELIEGCLRVASQYRFQNMPCTTQFHIERDGAFLLDKHGKRATV